MPIQDPGLKGVSLRHAPHIARIASEENCFIFVRPSTDDTVRLIDAGFATKSNDVHDKSSDWGPMAGFVTVDQGLNKKSNSPNPNWRAVLGKANSHIHGISQTVHLTIQEDLAAQQPMFPTALRRRVVKLGPAGILKGLPRDHFIVSDTVDGPTEKFRFYQSRKHTKPLFARRESNGEIYWLHEPGFGKPSRLVPVFVWAYHGLAITGDYDLWLVAPHISNASDGKFSRLLRIYNTVDEHASPSAATEFIVTLNAKLNAACAVANTQQVFNHGAEAQNYGFTQAFEDKPFAMFTPSGGWRNIDPSIAHHALNEIERRGYVVLRNKKWLSSNPSLADSPHRTDALWDRAARHVAEHKDWKQIGAVPRAMPDAATVDARLGHQPEAKEVGERAGLAAFGQRLRQEQSKPTVGWRRDMPQQDHLIALKPDDFPASVKVLNPLQRSALRVASNVATARMTGGGATVDAGGNLDLTGLGSDPNAFAKAHAAPRK